MHVTEITDVISCNAHVIRLVGVFYGDGIGDGAVEKVEIQTRPIENSVRAMPNAASSSLGMPLLMPVSGACPTYVSADAPT